MHYHVEALIGDVGEVDTRVGRHDAARHQVGSDLFLFGRDVNLRRRRVLMEVSVSEHETASVDGETPAKKTRSIHSLPYSPHHRYCCTLLHR